MRDLQGNPKQFSAKKAVSKCTKHSEGAQETKPDDWKARQKKTLTKA
jgi:hypothetical protein